MEELKTRIFTRYGLGSNSLKQGTLHFFCLADDPYKRAIDTILRETIQSALRKDMINIVGDFNKVYRKEASLVDVEQK